MSSEDIDRDAWLREALRHAPDAGLAPPSDLSEAILRAAQAQARSAAPPVRRRPSWTQRLWMWLAQPAVGAGLASVMVAGVVGTMWWDRPLPEPTARSAPAEAPTTVAQAPGEMTDRAATAPAAETAAPPATPSVTAAAPPVPESRKRESAPSDEALRRRTQQARPEPPPADASLGAAADATGPAAPALALPEATANAPAAAAAPQPSRPPQRALAKSGAAPRGADNFVAADSEPAAMARAFIAMRLAVSTESQRWTWRRGADAPQPIVDGLTAWLAELDAATATRWQRAAPDATTPPAPAPALQLLREGRVVHTLRLGADELRWESADADGGSVTARVATIAPDRARALREALSRIR